MVVQQVPIADRVFTWPADAPQLIGSECSACGVIVFPRSTSCPRCAGDALRDRLLARTGTLWTWTTQGFLPKWPYTGTETEETFAPYLLGYVELPDEVRVETRIVDAAADSLWIGMPMELTIVVHRTDEHGNEIVSFAFRPSEGTRPSGGTQPSEGAQP